MILKLGDHGLAVSLMKVRFDAIRNALIGRGLQCNWGASTTTDVFDLIEWWNVGAFQAQFPPLVVDHIYGPATNSTMQLLELLLDIHY